MHPITRDILHPDPVTPTELKVIRGRVGSLNAGEVEGHAPYTLKLTKVEARKGMNGWVITETWELNQ